MTVHNIGTIFKKDKFFWDKSIFVSCSEQQLAIDRERILKRRTDANKSIVYSKGSPSPNVVCISDSTKDFFLLEDKRSFWEKVLEKCERAFVHVVSLAWSQHKILR